MNSSFGSPSIFCEACKLNYNPTRRRAECPHVSTVGESSYLSKLREQGPPYKLEDRQRVEDIDTRPGAL